MVLGIVSYTPQTDWGVLKEGALQELQTSPEGVLNRPYKVFISHPGPLKLRPNTHPEPSGEGRGSQELHSAPNLVTGTPNYSL